MSLVNGLLNTLISLICVKTGAHRAGNSKPLNSLASVKLSTRLRRAVIAETARVFLHRPRTSTLNYLSIGQMRRARAIFRFGRPAGPAGRGGI